MTRHRNASGGLNETRESRDGRFMLLCVEESEDVRDGVFYLDLIVRQFLGHR